jgi:excinuclease ABC subunit A
MSNQKYISIRGARVHNLQNVDVDIPRNKITVVTGVSGSGKSSLAFDTIYAEGQRRFVESLSSYARQFLEQMQKPDLDKIEGLPPAVAIEQNPPHKNPRSTVGTTTEIYDYFRLIYGRIGRTICVESGQEVKKNSPADATDEIFSKDENTKIYILFQISEHEENNIQRKINTFRENGYFRVILKNSTEIIDLENDSLPTSIKSDEFYFLADRLVIKHDDETKSRLFDSLEHAFSFGEGRVTVLDLNKNKFHNFSSIYECSVSGRTYIEPEPKLFSFNNAFGACSKCQGFGRSVGIDGKLVIPNRALSLERACIAAFMGAQHGAHQKNLIQMALQNNVRIDVPYAELNDEEISFVWNGKDEYIGIHNFFQELEDKNYKVQNRVMLARYRAYTKCSACDGSRLRTSARQVFVHDTNIRQILTTPIGELADWFGNIDFTNHEMEIIKQVREEILWRLNLLLDIGLGYLTLDRLTHSLSGGEFQRINLSTALGQSLVGTLYVLDEPSTGMHPRDTDRLLKILNKLRNIGNTILLVEHDPEIMVAADNIIDIGPKAGKNGGNLIHSGNYNSLLKNKKSLTGKYLRGEKKIEIPKKTRELTGKKITVKFARENNLLIDKIDFPIGVMTAVTGVSGSGKSTLVHDILFAGIKKFFGGFSGEVGKHERIDGFEDFDDIEMVDQSPVGKSSRSTPVTYNKAFDIIREEFARTQHAKQLGIKAGYFSFNVSGGRCEVCEGEGSTTIDMQFLPDVKLECESCGGTRYKREARSILLHGKSVVDVLNMTISEALDFFAFNKRITKKLQILADVGLGYIHLGQPSTMLSGGEAQRIKLAVHLEVSQKNKKIFIFDEPTTGLHLDDISKLIFCFNRLVGHGHTVIIIEHNLHVISTCDWVIDLGPEAGADGGKVVAEGMPKQIAKKNTHTSLALKKFYEEEESKNPNKT